MPIVLCVVGIVLGSWQNGAKRTSSLTSVDESESKPDALARTDSVSYVFQRAVYPPQRLFATVADSIGSFAYGLTRASALKQRVDELESQATRMQGYKERVAMLEAEIQRLRDLEGLPKSPGRTTISGDIVGYYPSENRLMLNIGRGQGVRPGSPVVASAGLIGQVVEVTPTSSFVNLVTHPDFAAGARVVRNASQEAGIANGQSGPQLLLSIFNETADIQVGDLVTTSGLSEVYPEGIVIGRVTWLDTDKNLGVRQALVKPVVNLAKIRHVAVLAK